jgi:hypothetical protein
VKNIQVIDGAANSIFGIYQVPDDLFDVMFPNGTDVAFVDEIGKDFETRQGKRLWNMVYQHPVNKKRVDGIHGTLHLTGSPVDKEYFPTRKEGEVITSRVIQHVRSYPQNPDKERT